MVALPRTIDVEKEAKQGGSRILIEEGKYPAVIISSESKETAKKGHMIVFEIVITAGQHKDTSFTKMINYINENPQAVEIGMREIANIGKALGLTNVSNTVELHNKPLLIEVKNKKQKDFTNEKGEVVEGKDASEIVKYHPMPSGGFTEQSAPVVKQEQAQQVQATTAVNAPANNPFAAPN